MPRTSLPPALALLLLGLASAASGLQMISRSAWGAQSPRWAFTRFRATPTMLVVHHTATAACSGRAECVRRVRAIQRGHLAKYNDIAYNFLIAPSGHVYVGRGWPYQGSHAGSQSDNRRSIGVAFIGDYRQRDVSGAAWQAFVELLAYARQHGKITPQAPVRGHRDLKSTACPGNMLYARIRS